MIAGAHAYARRTSRLRLRVSSIRDRHVSAQVAALHAAWTSACARACDSNVLTRPAVPHTFVVGSSIVARWPSYYSPSSSSSSFSSYSSSSSPSSYPSSSSSSFLPFSLSFPPPSPPLSCGDIKTTTSLGGDNDHNRNLKTATNLEHNHFTSEVKTTSNPNSNVSSSSSRPLISPGSTSSSSPSSLREASIVGVEGLRADALLQFAPMLQFHLDSSDTVVVYVGSNDIFDGADAERVISLLRHLFIVLRPCRILYVGVLKSPFMRHFMSDGQVDSFNDRVEQMLCARRDGSHVVRVDAMPDDAFVRDGVHLRRGGYERLTRAVEDARRVGRT